MRAGVDTRRLRAEILIVLTVTFGMSGARSLLRLIDDLLAAEPLNEQEVTLNVTQSDLAWLDLALQLCSAGVLFAWGALALFLLAGDGIRAVRPRWSDLGWGAGLAAVIGTPGLGLYVVAVQTGLSKVVVPTGLSHPGIEVPVLLLWSLANAFGEEVVVVMWLMTRLRGLGWSLPAVLVGSSLVRGSYHLYQGVSAGVGNIVMGLVYGAFYARTGRIWPLVIAHFLIDAVAFVGYSALGGDLGWLGL
ncbi:CAAX amino terminal protease self- immunity [Corynebacterium guangdongense]|uniref:Membrane protease YdiL (CAAX protease family) n=2 Tax=Corynebacterium guangdongense TaxID=1783348 RepID=A0ABU2A1K1_9CORY|nr:membrane protease YdiL (CAAX protease family) [Corynebacterium guangdongense]WJZ19034.1 CAAX amino terminal protease self- immunity [Corynebacterium guangdongense]